MASRGKTSKGQVRIIGGERRGHRLHFVDQRGDLRPSSDRIRETLFNWLQGELGGALVLDLFAGSGALGAEALSRGAERAVLVERKQDRCADLSRQLKPLFGERAVVRCADALKWLVQDGERYHLAFIDPPYDLGLAGQACQALEQHGLLMPDARVYVESRKQAPAPEVPSRWELLRDKEGGDVRAQLYRV